jgi:hypothetical protein
MTLSSRRCAMSTEFTIREGRDIRELFGSGRATWAGSGVAKLGLTGDVKPEDLEALAELVPDEDEDQEDEVGSCDAKPAGGLSLIEQMRRDGTL